MPGGLSSVTVAARLVHDAGETAVVIKVAPPGLPPVRNRDVLRQATLLDALAAVPGFPVPAVLFRDPGDPPEVPPLFGMELAPGEAYEPMLDVADQPPSAAIAAERMRVAARGLGSLHAVPPSALGLPSTPGPADSTTSTAFPAVGLDQEVGRWVRLLETIDPDLCPGHEELARRLRARLPTPAPARVHHGDYRVANMLFVDATLHAVIDWELGGVGDPRWDLAWLLMHTRPPYRFHPERPAADEAAGSVVPTPDELVAEYLAAHRTRTAELPWFTDLPWFTAGSAYKGISTVAALHKRASQQPDPDPLVMTAGAHLGDLLDAGHRALDGWS